MIPNTIIALPFPENVSAAVCLQTAEDLRSPEWHDDAASAVQQGGLDYWLTQAGLSSQAHQSALGVLSRLIADPSYTPPARPEPPPAAPKRRLLTEQQAESIHILYAQGLSISDIAQRLDTWPATVRRVLGGKSREQARDALVRGLASLVIHFARVYRPLSRLLDVYDLCQEGWIGALQAVRKYRASGGVPLRVYAMYPIRAAISHAVRSFDHHKARVRVETTSDSSVFENHVGTWERPRLLLDVVAQLPPNERLCIGLYYYGGWDADLIAQKMGLKPDTVEGLRRDALRHLRAQLGVQPPQPRRSKPRTSGLNDEAVRQMRELKQAGWTYKALGLRFGVSQMYAFHICQGKYFPEAGGPLATRCERRSTAELKPEVFRLRAAGLSQRAIAGELGVTQSRVSEILLEKVH